MILPLSKVCVGSTESRKGVCGVVLCSDCSEDVVKIVHWKPDLRKSSGRWVDGRRRTHRHLDLKY
jgi:hypothetical protein